MNYNRCLLRSPVPGTVGLWVGCEQAKGEFCLSDAECNPDNCEDYTNYTCISDHCCEQDEMWDICSSSCVMVTCASAGLPLPPEGPALYACDDEHTTGTAMCDGACGVSCFHGYVVPSGPWTSQRCSPLSQCIRYDVFGTEGTTDGGKKICYSCIENLTACCVSGMLATTDAQCKACGVAVGEVWYLNGTHCCPRDYEWSIVLGQCEKHDPCFSASSNIAYCNYHAPDSPIFSLLAPWLSTNPQCMDFGESPAQACCFLGAGLFGWVTGEDFYYYHEREAITTY